MALITSSSGRPGGSWVTTYTPYDRLPEVKDKADRESATHLCLCRLCRSSLPFVSSHCPLPFVYAVRLCLSSLPTALCLSSLPSAFRLCTLPFVCALCLSSLPSPFVSSLCLLLRFHSATALLFSAFRCVSTVPIARFSLCPAVSRTTRCCAPALPAGTPNQLTAPGCLCPSPSPVLRLSFPPLPVLSSHLSGHPKSTYRALGVFVRAGMLIWSSRVTQGRSSSTASAVTSTAIGAPPLEPHIKLHCARTKTPRRGKLFWGSGEMRREDGGGRERRRK